MSGRWRVGQYYSIHVYEGERPVATFHRQEDALAAVEAMNRLAAAPCGHIWMARGSFGDEWRECFLCGKQEDA